ncbi:hypothetical protein Arub01_18240 [Actinomadura rubrobrunea]|uniref:DUF2017 domain-containing protein n=1 Tax=Actinomadura rubrobrunea TaxID=115335 RepID=A0A9W6PSB1_9ACTN|nr:DUF2017 domain-containing protein [Actinomadura rubrobrunea]GLW63580.1 hypothetical protein Arub01_18240 [Actinomadura rubrobrunea]
MSAVKKVRGGVSVRLEAEEAALVRALMEQLLELLGQDAPGPGDELAAVGISDRTAPPDDPVLARLFPDAYQEDERAAGEFRRYTEMGLRDGKREAARTVLKTLERGREAVLDEEEAQIWLRALNDVRLALGTRLDITEEWYEEAAELDPRDPRAPMFAAYDWLTMLQESLVRAVW